MMERQDAWWQHAPVFDPRDFGAVGDGVALDSPAINRAIAKAVDAGGGTIRLSAGTYRAFSVRLASRIRLHLEAGAVLRAADPPHEPTATGGYDLPEPSPAEDFPYQDFGHSHFRNSLLSGLGLTDVVIDGPGLIWGAGLVNGDYEPGHLPAMQAGVGNKALALFDCQRVLIRDVTILEAGHFAILATGCADMVVERVRIDTNRDGINLDCCRNVRVENCRINSPNDDGICLKSTYALGRLAMAEDILIRGNWVSGRYQLGSTLDGTYRFIDEGPEKTANVTHRTGRIKFGTESNGGFRRVRIIDNHLQGSRGLALETVDGAVLEDVTIRGLTMRDLRHAPIYIRLGARLRGPAGTRPGILRGITIADVEAHQSFSSMPIIIAGIPGARIEDITLRHIHLQQPGGQSARIARQRVPEAIASYPDPECFGVDLPGSGLFARHVKGLTLHRFTVNCAEPDARPVAWLQDVIGGSVETRHLHNLTASPAIHAEAAVAIRVRQNGRRPFKLTQGPRYLPVLPEDAHG
ncbi:right-handed parallel beta-helix repeat-containing protein [Acidisoma cellulosilytica]|uniref:Right-handed parallel beta-helix repeat-containing protein n=1 Tax=Acidisoma cellulosilyticum TaxID=2802395 RepID=A0A963Z721_9PROT|nr:right-handed parallel beta-helix repeat-containing protein [Acidisoma cellulosilyticum]MCB8883295.1 right-handed parallel beta-helix repeat-containing protein [Acidisoma cellulosilyticum]